MSDILDSLGSCADVKTVIQRAEREQADLALWQRIAVWCYENSRPSWFLEILDYLISFKIKEKRFEDESHNTAKIKIINSLSAYYLKLAALECDHHRREEHFDKMKTFVNLSDKISIGESLTFSLKGFLFFYQGEFKKA